MKKQPISQVGHVTHKSHADRVTHMLGRYFARNNGITHPSDPTIVFKNNAEDCYQSWQAIRLAAITALVMGVILMTAVTLDSGIRSVTENLIVAGLDSLIVAFLLCGAVWIKNIRKTPKVKMALKWSGYRKTVRHFAKRIDLLQIGEQDQVCKDIDHFLYLAKKALAQVILQKKYDTHSDIHPKEERLKGNLDELEISLGRLSKYDCAEREIRWNRILNEVKAQLGLRS